MEQREVQSSSNTEAMNKAKLSDKSRQRYEAVYCRFMEWRAENQIETFSESDMMKYFNKLIKDDMLKTSTVIVVYWILRTTLLAKNNVDIAKYTNMYHSLKKQSKEYKPPKSKVFTPKQIHDFINRAPDYKYLLAKVAMIIGVSGALFIKDFKELLLKDVHDKKNTLTIHLPDMKLTLSGKLYNVCKKYLTLRTSVKYEEVFFLNYQRGKCTKQVVGKNKFSSIPQEIASFLKLPNPKSFSGKSFRSTAETVGLDSKGHFVSGTWKKVLQSEFFDENDSDDDVKIISIKKEPPKEEI